MGKASLRRLRRDGSLVHRRGTEKKIDRPWATDGWWLVRFRVYLRIQKQPQHAPVSLSLSLECGTTTNSSMALQRREGQHWVWSFGIVVIIFLGTVVWHPLTVAGFCGGGSRSPFFLPIMSFRITTARRIGMRVRGVWNGGDRVSPSTLTAFHNNHHHNNNNNKARDNLPWQTSGGVAAAASVATSGSASSSFSSTSSSFLNDANNNNNNKSPKDGTVDTDTSSSDSSSLSSSKWSGWVSELHHVYQTLGTDGVRHWVHDQRAHEELSPGEIVALAHAAAPPGQLGTAASILNAWIASYYRNDNPLKTDKLCENIHVNESHPHPALALYEAWHQQAAKSHASASPSSVAPKHAGSSSKGSPKQSTKSSSLQQQPQPHLEGSCCRPDLLTYALTYAVLTGGPPTKMTLDESSLEGPPPNPHAVAAQHVLEQGLQWSKKMATTKQHRKAIAAALRHEQQQRQDAINNNTKKQGKGQKRSTTPSTASPPLTVKDHVSKIQSLLQNNEFDVLAETNDWVVVYKPAGVVCLHQSNHPADDTSLVEALVQCHIALSTLNPEAPCLVHRLDRGTSGCLFLAKTNPTHAWAIAEWYCRHTSKTYHTLGVPITSSWSTPPQPPSTTSTTGDNQDDSHSLSPSSPKQPPHTNHDDEWVVVDLPVDQRPAQSAYRLVQDFVVSVPQNRDHSPTTKSKHHATTDSCSSPTRETRAANDDDDTRSSTIVRATWMEWKTFTGRKHQVRVHAADGVQAPVLLDPLYGPASRNKQGRHNNNKKEDNKDAHTALAHWLSLSSSLDHDSNHKSKRKKKGSSSPRDERFFLHASHLSVPAFGIQVQAPTPPSWWQPALHQLRQHNQLGTNEPDDDDDQNDNPTTTTHEGDDGS